MKMIVNVSGMTCQMCAKHTREAIEGVEGTSNVEVDLPSGQATFDLGSASLDAVIAAIEEEGYQAQPA